MEKKCNCGGIENENWSHETWCDKIKKNKMEYELIQSRNLNNKYKLTCICGKCNPIITINENTKEEFKKLLGWSEEEFKKKTKEKNGK